MIFVALLFLLLVLCLLLQLFLSNTAVVDIIFADDSIFTVA